MKAMRGNGFTQRMGYTLDNILSLFSPGLANSRMIAREQLSERLYAAALPTADAGGWIPLDQDVNTLIGNSSPMVRARIRQQVRDFPYARRAINLRTALIVGPGIRMLPRIRDSKGNLNTEANAIVDTWFSRWAEKCDLAEKLSLPDLQKLAERQNFENGEFFFLKHYLRGKAHPLRLQPIEPDRLTSLCAKPAEGNVVDSGIEYNKATGKVIAYHFQEDGLAYKVIRVPADRVIHGYEMERPDQLRGISPIAPAVMLSGNLADLLTSELEAMRMASKYMAFVRTNDLPGVQAGADRKGKLSRTEYLGNATIQYMRTGDDIHLAKIDRQSGTFEPYLKFNLSTYAVCASLSYHLLSGNYDGIAYANLRGIWLDLAKVLRPIQKFHVEKGCKPIGRAWLEAGMLVNPDLAQLARVITPQSMWWLPPGMESPDSLREVRAQESEIKMGLRSPQEIAAARGRPLADIMDEIKEAQNMAEERGLVLGDVYTGLKTNPAELLKEQ